MLMLYSCPSRDTGHVQMQVDLAFMRRMVSLYNAMIRLQSTILRSYTASTASTVAKLLLSLVIKKQQRVQCLRLSIA